MFISDNYVFQVCSQLKMMKDDDWSSSETGLNGEMKCFGMDITVCGKKHLFTYISIIDCAPSCHGILPTYSISACWIIIYHVQRRHFGLQ